MSLDTRIRKAVRRAIHAIGTTATIRRVAVGAYDTSTGTVARAETDFEVVGRLDDYTDRDFATGRVKVGDRKFTCAATDLSFSPVPGDQVVIDDLVYTIVNPGGVSREMAQHQPAMYIFQLRR